MSTIYFNGEYIKDNKPIIASNDCGFTTGIGIFDSILAHNGKGVYAQEHYERIIHDAKTVIGLEPALSFDDFEKIYVELLQKNNLNENYARIRTTITGGEVSAPLARATQLTILISVGLAENPDNTEPCEATIITEFPRIAGCALENCKRLDYSRSYAARRLAEELGAQEAILTNTDGNVACATTSNIFIEENNILITPPLKDGVLAGVTRRKFIEKREVKQESISIERLKGADKIYLTNSFFGLRHVTLI